MRKAVIAGGSSQSIPVSPTIAYWVKAYKGGKMGDTGKDQKSLTEVEKELARTEKELAEVKMDRDTL